MSYEGTQENIECLDRLQLRLGHVFGAAAPVIMRVLAEELGGLRLTFPDLAAIHRRDRDTRIRLEFRGCNTEELAIKFSLSSSQIRRIVAKR